MVKTSKKQKPKVTKAQKAARTRKELQAFRTAYFGEADDSSE